MRDKHSRGISTMVMVLIVGIVVVAIGATAIYFWWNQRELVGSGNLDTKVFDFTDFTIVEAGYGFKVEIDQSSSYSITLTADDNVIDRVQVSKSGDTFKIGLKPGMYVLATLKAEITMPDLAELEFSGGTQGTVQGFYSSHGFILTLSGGSGVEIEGEANELTVDASGGSHFELSAFPVNNVNVVLSGGSGGTINLDGRLEADVSGGSHLQYIGEPTMGDIETSGGSTVEKK